MTFPALTAEETDLGVISLRTEAVQAYREAVGDTSKVSADAVPPTGLAAWCLARLIERMGLPAGTLHGTQEIESLRAVRPGDEVRCGAKLGGRSQRGGWEFTTVDFTLRDRSGETVLCGRSMVMQRMPGKEA